MGPSRAGSLHARYIGSYPLSQDGSLRAPSALVTNLRIQRRLSEDMTLALDTLNLSVPDGVTVHPGEPRQFRLSLAIEL